MSRAIVGVLIDSSLRALLLAALVAVCLGALRVRATGLRHGAWTAVLAGMVLMPMLTRIAPTFSVAVPNVPPGHIFEQTVERLTGDERVPTTTAAANQLRERAGQTVPSAVTASRPPWPWAATGMCVYVIGLLVLLVRTWAGWRRAARLVAASEPIIVPRELAGIASRPGDDIRESSAVSVPLVVGWIRPAVVLPVDWLRWTEIDLRAVLVHELAHVARRDPLVAALAHANACLFWFHPLAWWLKRHLAILAERACDEAGVRSVGEPQAYAQALIRMAALARRNGGRLQPHAVGIDGQGPLARRIDRVLLHDLPRASRLSSTLVAASCSAAIAIAAGCSGGNDEAAGRRRIEQFLDYFADTEVAVSEADRPLAEEVLLQRMAADPSGSWPERLGRFYAASIVGHWVRVTERGPLQEITGIDPMADREFAAKARRKLAESDDPAMLLAAAGYLRHTPSVSTLSWPSREDVEALARSCLERAVRLQPDSVEARAELVSIASSARSWTEWRAGMGVSTIELEGVVSSLPEAEQFEFLPERAVGLLVSARSAARWNDRNLDDYVRLKTDLARKFSEKLLVLAQKFESHSSHGFVVYRANMILASLAAREGDPASAVRHLAAASNAPPSEEIAYLKGIASWWLIPDLLKAGERAAVAGFLERMAEKSVVDRERLLDAAAAVRSGQPPEGLMRGVHRAMP
jgi:beta-lactamase regulating signal transducer with metallopeptidase domain